MKEKCSLFFFKEKIRVNKMMTRSVQRCVQLFKLKNEWQLKKNVCYIWHKNKERKSNLFDQNYFFVFTFLFLMLKNRNMKKNACKGMLFSILNSPYLNLIKFFFKVWQIFSIFLEKLNILSNFIYTIFLLAYW